MNQKCFILDDRPDYALSEEEKRKRREETERIIGKDKMSKLYEEFKKWEKEQNQRK